jgi:hypothetical protein
MIVCSKGRRDAWLCIDMPAKSVLRLRNLVNFIPSWQSRHNNEVLKTMKLHTIHESAGLLRMSKRSFFYMLQRGEIKRTRLAGKVLISDSELMRVINKAVSASA